MIPYGHQTINNCDIEAVVKTLKSDWLTQGPEVLKFEKKLAAYCGAKFAVAVSSGTAALHLAYLAAGLKPGDEIITSPNTFMATANMLLAVGAKPVFCDIRLDTYNIDEAKIEKLISLKTKVIVPIHFSGQPCQLDKIREIAQKNKLLVIEDACHALGAKFRDSKIGDCRFSDLAVFSFHPVKSITTGEGGAILTNNKKYYEKLKLLSNHGIYKNSQGKNVMVELGYNYRLSDIHSALGLSQLDKIDKFLKLRRKIVKLYEKELSGVKGIILPQELKGNYSSWHIYIIRTAKPAERSRLVDFLKAKGVAVNFHYPAVYSHPFYRQNGYQSIKLNNEEAYQNSCLTLPCYPELSAAKIKRVCSLIKNFYAGKNNN